MEFDAPQMYEDGCRESNVCVCDAGKSPVQLGELRSVERYQLRKMGKVTGSYVISAKTS